MSPGGGHRASSDRGAGLSDRQLRILSILVREYIERGEPVSSLWLAEHSGFRVSSATVRNVLAGLEESGHLHQPHTSAGRIPTDRGYRSYVDLLLQSRRPSRPAPEIEARLRQAGTLEDALADVSHELARAAHHLAFALAPVDERITLKHIEFVALDAARVLVVVVAGNGQVWHKVVTTGESLAPSDLTQAANYLNLEFAGRHLADIRTEIVERLHQDRVLYDELLARALSLASDTLVEVAPEPRLFVHGASSLVESAGEDSEHIPLEGLRVVLAMIEEKHRLVRLLTEYIEGRGLTVVIGAEHPRPDLRDFSLVAATYVEGPHVATVGVLGPRRMRYSRAIAAVDSVSQAIGRILVAPDN
jgi:heat-inducible transcriptional repressor